jgi:hypothetical protein
MDSRSIGVGWPPLGGDSEKVFRTRPPLQVDQLVIANIRGYVRSNASGGALRASPRPRSARSRFL